MLGQMQRVEVTVHVVNETDLDPALRRLRLLAKALQQGGADLKSVAVLFQAVTSYQMAVTRELVEARRERVLSGLEADGEDALFKRILSESSIRSVQ